MRNFCASLFAVNAVVQMLIAGVIQAAVYRVPQDYSSIQSALNEATSSDTVLVSPGTYFEQIIAPSSRSLISESGAAVTIIDGQSYGRVLDAPNVYLRGFTIQHGKVFETGGAGIRGYGTIEECIFLGNSTAPYNNLRGGAVRGNFTIRDTEFISNTAQESGGAVYGARTMERCRFIGNNARAGWGGAVDQGTVIDCYFEGNRANSGAVALYNATPVGCVFGPHGGYNGVIRGASTIRDCVFYDHSNTHTVYDAGGAGTVIENCTFVNTRLAIGVYDTGSTTVNRCIFVGNDDVYQRGNYASISIDCSVFWLNGDDNLDAGANREIDPLFCDPVEKNFALNDGSPCLPENSGGCALIGALGQGCGTVPIKRRTWGAIKRRFGD